MLSKLRNMWALAKKDPKQLEQLLETPKNVLEQIPEQGDGKAIFFSEGTEKDYEKFQNEQSGMSKWLERLRNLK